MKLNHRIGRFIMGLKRPSKSTNMRRLREWGETLEAFTIREVTMNDLPALAALHVQTWADTYWTIKIHPLTRYVNTSGVSNSGNKMVAGFAL
ncbi:hypothetical protein [Paraflavitalea speifideaquila]|uniref:hypothetical protein n=1 Tax=Paraflavitalea speifideaquila TaxID=3076558 RepID=UPI0028E3D7BF|nr:hypothetical protein [Paraflavitalea speifideiaquila]